MQIRPDEWKKIFELRDDLDGEDRMLLRKLVKYVEHLELEIRKAGDRMHQIVSKGADYNDD